MSDDAVKAVLEDFILNEAKYTQAKEAYNASRKALLALVPQEVGQFEVKHDKIKATIKFPEKAVWDAEQLEALYGADKPLYVKASYSIDMRTLRRLPLSEQEKLNQCHEIKPGSPTIEVEVE